MEMLEKNSMEILVQIETAFFILGDAIYGIPEVKMLYL